ncbi:MAG: lysophospholipid acyltransferase family protein [Planctomycetaceae bacterium]
MSPDAIAGLTLASLLLLSLLLVVWHAVRSPAGWRLWVLYVIDALYCRLCFHWRANCACPFLEARPAILIANHRSPLDPILIWVGVTNRRPLEFLTAREYFRIRGLKFIFDATKAIPVARDGKDMAATRTALRRLREGRILGMFPEGRINTNPGPELLPADIGVAFLALHSQAPVYPVFIENAPRGTNMVNPFWHFTRVRIRYGDSIDLSSWYGRKLTPELLQEVTDLLMRRLAELGGVPTAGCPAPDDGEQPDVLPIAKRSAS